MASCNSMTSSGTKQNSRSKSLNQLSTVKYFGINTTDTQHATANSQPPEDSGTFSPAFYSVSSIVHTYSLALTVINNKLYVSKTICIYKLSKCLIYYHTTNLCRQKSHGVIIDRKLALIIFFDKNYQ